MYDDIEFREIEDQEMRRHMVLSLHRSAENTAELFSKDREGNVRNETYKVESIEVLSECTALVTFWKEPTKKKAVAWYYYINSRRKPRWEYFFVTYSHLVGLNRVASRLHAIEQHNSSVATREEPA
jgi:hypothetical protein